MTKKRSETSGQRPPAALISTQRWIVDMDRVNALPPDRGGGGWNPWPSPPPPDYWDTFPPPGRSGPPPAPVAPSPTTGSPLDPDTRLMGKRGVQINAEAIDLSNALTIKYDLQVDSGVWKISGDFRFNAAGEFTNGNARLDFRGSDGSRLTWYISGPPREVGIKGGHRWLIGGGFFFQIQGDYNFSTRNFQGMAYFGYDGDSK